jgi:hypothetical protein
MTVDAGSLGYLFPCRGGPRRARPGAVGRWRADTHQTCRHLSASYPEGRGYFHGTLAHNTVCVDHLDHGGRREFHVAPSRHDRRSKQAGKSGRRPAIGTTRRLQPPARCRAALSSHTLRTPAAAFCHRRSADGVTARSGVKTVRLIFDAPFMPARNLQDGTAGMRLGVAALRCEAADLYRSGKPPRKLDD